MDKFQQLAHDAEFGVVVLANPDTRDYQFVDLHRGAVSAETAKTYAERGLSFLGVVGIVRGAPRVALEDELTPEFSAFLTQSLVAHWKKQIRWTMPVDMNWN